MKVYTHTATGRIRIGRRIREAGSLDISSSGDIVTIRDIANNVIMNRHYSKIEREDGSSFTTTSQATSYLDGLNTVSSGDSTGGDSYVILWAEESSALNSGSYDWSWGNGDETPAGGGGCIPLPGNWTPTGVGLRLSSNGTAQVEVRKNGGAITGLSCSISGSKKAFTAFDDDSILFDANDSIDFRTVSGPGASGGNRVFVGFKRVS